MGPLLYYNSRVRNGCKLDRFGYVLNYAQYVDFAK